MTGKNAEINFKRNFKQVTQSMIWYYNMIYLQVEHSFITPWSEWRSSCRRSFSNWASRWHCLFWWQSSLSIMGLLVSYCSWLGWVVCWHACSRRVWCHLRRKYCCHLRTTDTTVICWIGVILNNSYRQLHNHHMHMVDLMDRNITNMFHIRNIRMLFIIVDIINTK